MELKRSNINVIYEIEGGDIKASQAGMMNNRIYSPSVKIICFREYEVFNEQTQFYNKVKQEVTFKIVCPDNSTAGKIARYFQDKFDKNEKIVCAGSLPDRNGVVTLDDPIERFLSDGAKDDVKDKKLSTQTSADKSANKA